MPLSPELIREAGRMLHGDEFHGALADDLGVSVRNVQRWCAGEKSAPAGVANDLAHLIARRASELTQKLAV